METIELSRPLEAEAGAAGSFQMIDVAWKDATHRRAIAEGTIRLQPDSYAALKEGRNPKGDVLKLAEIAGIQAAKRTADLIPLCHPLALEKVRIRFRCDDPGLSVTVFCEVSTTAKTGVEMEALSGVNGALLAIYDLSKAVNPVLTISEVRLALKEGGKHGSWVHPMRSRPDPRSAQFGAREPAPESRREECLLEEVPSATLTISDRCARGVATDRSGPLIQDYLEKNGAKLVAETLVPDEVEEIRGAVLRFVREHRAKLVITTGGTGLGPRDRTPEALEPLWDRRIPGFGEILRARGALHTEMSWLSRSEAGLVQGALVILLPGSSKAVLEGLETLSRLLPHALEIVKGGSH